MRAAELVGQTHEAICPKTPESGSRPLISVALLAPGTVPALPVKVGTAAGVQMSLCLSNGEPWALEVRVLTNAFQKQGGSSAPLPRLR